MKSSKSVSTAATPTWKWPSSIWGRLEGFQSFSSVQFNSVQFSSGPQSCPTLCNPMDCSTPGFPVHHQLPESVMPFNQFILCHPLLLPPSIFPSIRVFSNESVLCIRWPNQWSFSFTISPSNEYSRLISFRMDWLDCLLTWLISILYENLKQLLPRSWWVFHLILLLPSDYLFPNI